MVVSKLGVKGHILIQKSCFPCEQSVLHNILFIYSQNCQQDAKPSVILFKHALACVIFFVLAWTGKFDFQVLFNN